MQILPIQMQILSMLAIISLNIKLNFSCNVLFHMKTRIRLEYFVHYCLWKQEWFCSQDVPGLFKLELLDNFGNSKAFNTDLT